MAKGREHRVTPLHKGSEPHRLNGYRPEKHAWGQQLVVTSTDSLQMVHGICTFSSGLGSTNGACGVQYAHGSAFDSPKRLLTDATVRHLVSGPRLPFTATYFGSIALTLYFAVGVSHFLKRYLFDITVHVHKGSTSLHRDYSFILRF